MDHLNTEFASKLRKLITIKPFQDMVSKLRRCMLKQFYNLIYRVTKFKANQVKMLGFRSKMSDTAIQDPIQLPEYIQKLYNREDIIPTPPTHHNPSKT